MAQQGFGQPRRKRGGVAALLLSLLCGLPAALAQEDPNAFGVPITVSPPRDRLRAMYEAATLAEREQYPAAAKALQGVFESPEDYFLEHDLQSTLKQRAHALLASWPRVGREAYDRQYAATAAALREQAERSGSYRDWSALLSQYGMTPAGRAAAEQWAAQSVDLGQPLLAGLYWRQLRATQAGGSADAASGLREALAWELAGRPDLRRARLALLGEESAKGPIALGGRVFEGKEAFSDAITWLGEHAPQPGDERGRQTVRDWPSARGHNARNAVAWPAGPIGVPAWTQSVLDEVCEPIVGSPDMNRRAVVRQSLVDLEERLIAEDRLTWPAAVPVICGHTVVVRTLAGLAAFDLDTGTLKWRSSLDESLFRKRWNAVPLRSADGNADAASDSAMQQFMRERLFRDSVQGTVACDDRAVYAIESNIEPLPVPVAPNAIRPTLDIPDPVNRLVAFDLDGGELLWELGGPRGDAALPLAGYFFLGPPLVREGALYCLAEADDELRLLHLSIDPTTRRATLVWSQVLVAPEQSVASARLRRVAGLTPTWADGILLCPTGCGILVAVDPLRKQFVWGYKYDSLEPRQFNPRTMMMMRQQGAGRMIVPIRVDEEQSRWMDAVPLYAQGHVLFTPRDASEMHCLDAVTGEVRWKRPRGAALSVAGVQDGRVILVGRSNVEAIRLSDGELDWSTPTPLPVGQGLLLAQRFLLPVIENAVLTLDLTSGRILSHSTFDPFLGTGNLIAANGALIAASTRGISKFSALDELEKNLNQRLSADANDAAALAVRGELRLHRGDQAAGLDDLRRSLRQRPDARTGALLANTLVDGLRSDFPRFRERAEEIDRLVTDSAGRSHFLRTYARGLVQAGEREAALNEFLKLMELTGIDQQLERVSGGWSVRGDRVVRGQVRGLYESASPAEQQRLDAALAAFASKATTEDKAAVRDRQLLRCFESLSALDPLRVQLLMQNTETPPPSANFLVARKLIDSTQTRSAATGTAWLAKGLITQQRFDEALPLLQRLETDFKSIPLAFPAPADRQTGAAIAESLRSTWVNPLANGGWGDADLVVERKVRPVEIERITPVEIVGTTPEAWRDWTFEFTERSEHALSARDSHGRLRWKVVIPPLTDRGDLRIGSIAPLHFLRITGDRMVLSLTGRFVALDLTAGPKPVVRWQHDLTTRSENNANMPMIGLRADILPCGRRRFLATNVYDSTDYSPTGQVLGLTDESVCYTQGGRLVMADVETGRIQWIRLAVPQEVEGTATGEAVTLFDMARQQAVVYRSDDGEELARREVGDPGTWLWFLGDQLLTVTTEADQSVTIQYRRLTKDRVVWEKKSLASGTRFFTSNGEDLYQWSPAGMISKWRLSDGEARWSAPAPADATADFIWVHHYADTEIFFVGNALTSQAMANNPNQFKTRINQLDANHLGFQGRVLGKKAATGAEVWSSELDLTAMDLAQHPNIPVLPFAARQSEPPRIVNGQFISPSRFVATILDKRNGDILYKTTETMMPNQFQMELDAEFPIVSLCFPGWMLEFRKDAAK